MDDSDLERHSQPESPHAMEVEAEQLPEFDTTTTLAGEARDMDIEYGEDTEKTADVTDQGVHDSRLLQDAQMTADADESQATLTEEKVPLMKASSEASSTIHPDRFQDASESVRKTVQDYSEHSQAVHEEVREDHEDPKESGSDHLLQQASTNPFESPLPSQGTSSVITGQPTSRGAADEAINNMTSEALKVIESSGTLDPDKEAFADADDFSENFAPAALDSTQVASSTPDDESPLHRPSLQKDYLSHVDVSHGHDPSAASYAFPHSIPHFAPHVSLIYEKQEYSLFRPSSSPSGDHEQVLFAQPEDSDTNTNHHAHQLYYKSLEHLIDGLHLAFPELKGEGENEILLDFGILDMQISEDNVYCRQLSLFDLDRIRLGMCQPELDRLQVTIKTGRRFAFRFNELAEHCYRMFAGSEDDSGTLYDETLEPLAEEADQEAAENNEYNENNAIMSNEPTSELAADYISGENVEDLADPIAAQNESEDATAEANLQTTEDYILSLPQNENEEASEYIETVGDDDVSGDVHPPSDEPYQDPEYYDDVDQEVELYEDHDEEDDDRTVQADSDEVGEKDFIEETRIVDPEASVEEAAKQVEEYEESTYEVPEGVVTDGKASNVGQTSIGSDRIVNVTGDDNTEEYYHNLTTPLDEQTVLVEEAPLNGSIEPNSVGEITKGTVLNDGMVEKDTESDTRSLLSGKRSRSDIDYSEDVGHVSDKNDIHDIANGDNNGTKRPKIAS